MSDLVEHAHEPAQEPKAGAAFWISLVIGWVVMAVGVKFFFDDRAANAPGYSAFFAVASNIAHDAFFAPLVCVIVWAGARLLPKILQPPAAFAFFGSVVVLSVAAVPLYREDDNGYNPTILPLDYKTSTATVIGVVWSIAAVWAVVVALRKRRVSRL